MLGIHSLSSADLNTLKIVLKEITDADFDARIFGGWAEELLGLSPARDHADIDLLLVDPDMEKLDNYVRERSEIIEKQLSHKRAFLHDGILVELFLVHHGATLFWGSFLYTWPSLEAVEKRGLRIAAAQDVLAYRRDYKAIHQSRP
jgi:hypothetical protein